MKTAAVDTPDIEFGGGKLAALVGDQVFWHGANSVDGGGEKLLDLLGGRLLFELGEGDDGVREMI